MRFEMPADLEAPVKARAAAAEFLSRHRSVDGQVVADAVLAVSELVTNAVQAGAHLLILRLALVAGDTETSDLLKIFVEDDAGGWPAAADPDLYSERGRGLQIVSHLADQWDVHRTGRGKQVVVTLPVY